MNKSLFALFVASMAFSAEACQFDTQSSQIQKSNISWDIYTPCDCQGDDYEVTYQNLPSGWKNENNRIKIPAGLVADGNYQIQSNVKNSHG
jgi:hypothetical protein